MKKVNVVTYNTTNIQTNFAIETAQSHYDVTIFEIIKRALDWGYSKPKFTTSSWPETTNSCVAFRFVTNEKNKVVKFIDQFLLITTEQLNYLIEKHLLKWNNKSFIKQLRKGLVL